MAVLPEKLTENCAFHIKVCDFTDFCKSHFPFADFHCSGRYIEELFRIHVSPYGCRKRNKKFLSIMFVSTPAMLMLLNHVTYISTFEFSCTSSVIDVNGNGRFRKSFVYVHEPQNTFDLDCLVFGFEEYVKPDICLGNSSELLPGDSLTVSIEIIFRHRCSLTDIFYHENVQKFFVKDGNSKYYLNLDSLYGNVLCEYSIVFRRMSETAMTEGESRRVYVLPEEYIPFQYILKFIVGASIKIKLAEYIPLMLEIYIVAYKYDMKVVVEACRYHLESILNSMNDWIFFEHVMENILNVLEFAERFDEKRLRECAENILENRENIEAHLKKKMKMESDLLETKPTVGVILRRMADYKQKPQLCKIVEEPLSLKTVPQECEVRPQLDFYA